MLRIALTAVGVHDHRPRFDLLLLDGPRTNASGSAATELFEPAFVEGRRRTKVIDRFPGETSCLSLCWAVLDLVIARANRVRFDDLDRQLIERIAAELDRSREDEEVIAA